MIDAGATSFWEEFSPDIKWQNQLGMYGEKYGKSLCHAWGASPVYLIGRYLLGVKPTSAGYETFEIKPELDRFDWVEATVPIKEGSVSIKKKGGKLEIAADRDGGVLIYHFKKYALYKNKPLVLEITDH